MKIPLTQGNSALVDADDYEVLMSHRWHSHRQGYAVRKVMIEGKSKTLYMHRVLLNPPIGYEVDHLNGNKLDNRRSNLRLATRSQNTCNTGVRITNMSGFKGVTYSAHAKKWKARIVVEGCARHIGYYPTPETAHAAYCAAALKHHGEFARTA